MAHRDLLKPILSSPWFQPWVRVWLTVEGFFLGHPIVDSAIHPPQPQEVW